MHEITPLFNAISLTMYKPNDIFYSFVYFYGYSLFDATNASKDFLIDQLVKFFLAIGQSTFRSICSAMWTAS